MSGHATEVSEGKRYPFGKNWRRFLGVLSDDRIQEAERSLREMLGAESLEGKRLLDIGSGSGLFSLAARRLGASVHSFDFDPDSVACTKELKRRYYAGDPQWKVEKGSVLDIDYVRSLGEFDIVYSWGVLHHTGDMWEALECARVPVRRGGLLFIAIYNDQGYRSTIWKWIKRRYCSGFSGRLFATVLVVPYFVFAGLILDVLRLKNPLVRYTEYKRQRGMSIYHDWFDWLGGYPFEVARPEQILDFFRLRGYELIKLKTTNGWGNNEFVLERRS